MCVLPEFQGRGVADQLVEAFCTASRQAGFEKLDLTVHSDNQRATAFYRKHRWKEVFQANGNTAFARDLKEPSI